MRTWIGFDEALSLTLAGIPTPSVEELPLGDVSGRVLAEPVTARVDAPGLDSSRKDGYAVLSADLDAASREAPVRLRITGSVNAGGRPGRGVRRGETMRLTTGAPIPEGAQAVLAEEFCHREGDFVECFARAEEGRNILKRGTDLQRGASIAQRGERVTPGLAGLLASSGLGSVRVCTRPRIAVLATGDEIVPPGQTIEDGQLYASNLLTLCGWLDRFGMETTAAVCGDERNALRENVERELDGADGLITSGGAWTSEKDLLLTVLTDLGWEGIYHRVRLGPGKGIAFGLLGGKPVFGLPGGPPSNEMAFLQLALPGLLAMQGWRGPVFPEARARLSQPVHGQDDWTQFIHAQLLEEEGVLTVEPAQLESRLRSMALKQALIRIPEGQTRLEAGGYTRVQVLDGEAWL